MIPIAQKYFIPAYGIFKNKKSCQQAAFLIFNGRIDWTRTSDLFVPNEAFYQAELQSECGNSNTT